MIHTDLVLVKIGVAAHDYECTYQSPKIVPHFGNMGVQAYSPRVSVKCIAVLIDLVVKNTNRTPKGRVPPISVHGLLICFVGFREFMLRHVASAK